MTVYTATRASTTRPAVGTGPAMSLQKSWGTYEVGAVMVLGDSFVMCKVPKGAVIVGGRLQGDKLDSAGAGTACMTLNIGVDAAVVTPAGTTVTTASTSNCLAAAWAIGSEIASIPGVHPEATGRDIPLGGLLISEGPLTVSDDCNVIIKVVSSNVSTYSGTLALQVDYYASTNS